MHTTGLHHHRALIVLADEDVLRFNALSNAISAFYSQNESNSPPTFYNSVTVDPVSMMHVPELHSNSDSSDQINRLLGSEYRCVIFDAYDAFNERLFAAAAGTVVGGGILLLRTPPLHTWAQNTGTAVPSAFMERFIRKIRSHQTGTLTGPTNTITSTAQSPLIIADDVNDNSLSTPIDLSWETEQNKLVGQLLSKLLGEQKSTIIVQADRGRGKSTLIGRALKKLLADKSFSKKRITLTANNKNACKVLMQHVGFTGGGTHPIQFVSIDTALNMQHDLLVIEEAGTLSIPVLTQLTSFSGDIIFATTVQGYEGAGRGFALRFAKRLDKIRPDWVKLQPERPIRWAANDPLEAFVNDALLLKTKLSSINQPAELKANNAQLSLIDHKELSSSDELLEAIYALLIQAHYQTTPSDLRNMLDQQQLLIFAQRTNNILTGAAIVAMEGEIATHLHTAIVYKERRLTDQILPQLLAQSASDASVLSLRCARIVRIAVHPSLHRRGFGSNLCHALIDQLTSRIDYVGASFGADEQTLSFWQSLGFTPIHYGFKKNPRSGLKSACLIKSTDKSAANSIDMAAWILHENLRALAQHDNQNDLVRDQLIAATRTANGRLTQAQMDQLIIDFCRSQRSFIDTVAFLHPDSAPFNPASSSTIGLDAATESFKMLTLPSDKIKPQQRREHQQRLQQYLLTG